MERMEWLGMLAKQVLSQLSYTPTARVTFILKYFSRFQNPFPRILQAVFESAQNTLQAGPYRLYICAHRSDNDKPALGPGVESDLWVTFETTIDWAYSSVKSLQKSSAV